MSVSDLVAEPLLVAKLRYGPTFGTDMRPNAETRRAPAAARMRRAVALGSGKYEELIRTETEAGGRETEGQKERERKWSLWRIKTITAIIII